MEMTAIKYCKYIGKYSDYAEGYMYKLWIHYNNGIYTVRKSTGFGMRMYVSLENLKKDWYIVRSGQININEKKKSLFKSGNVQDIS